MSPSLRRTLLERHVERVLRQRVEELSQECEALPDTDRAPVLFEDKNYRSIMLPFYADVLKHLYKPELAARLYACDLTGTALEIYRRINAGGHPVRDCLILLANGLITGEKKPVTDIRDRVYFAR